MRLIKTLSCLLLAPALAGAQDAPSEGAPLPRVEIVTNLGSFVLELDRERAPFTVGNFLDYAREGHYSGTIFHRVIHSFVAQAGGYTANMVAKPVERSVVNESGNGLTNLRGTIGLARTGEPHSGNAQFYINLADNPDLNPRPTRWGYTVFGRVIEGMDVVDEIGQKQTGAGGEFDRDVPLETIVIERAEILAE
ncbi:MAG TPA: peptidylprolyl isomerase [Gammaproteobacteria bacterium]|jgi:cyclophilin family peptidyl-prolyl cis-trans isomerase